MVHQTLLPEGWPRPKGYANGVLASGRQIFVGGQIGWNSQCEFETDVFSAQVAQALKNIVAVLASGGAGPEHLVRLTWYVTSRKDYLDQLADVGAAYRAIIGRHYPAMSVVEVTALMEARAKVEIEATAVV